MTPWFFLVIAFGTWKGKCTKILKKILRSGISEYLDKGIFTRRKCTSVEFTSFFFWRFFSKLLLYWNIKKKGSPDYFSCKSFREFSNSNARSRASKNPDSKRCSWSVTATANKCVCSRELLLHPITNVHKRLLLRKSFSSRLRQPSGLTLKDLLPTSDYISHIFIEKQQAKVWNGINSMENTCWLALRSECLFRDSESPNR